MDPVSQLRQVEESVSHVTVNEMFERSGVRIALVPDPATGRDRFQVMTCPTQDPFPRIMLHEGCNGRGYPLVYADGVLNESVAYKIARFGWWCVGATDLYDLWPGAIRRVRELNPKIKILVHVLGPTFWPSSGPTYTGRLAEGIGERWVMWGSGMYADLSDPVVIDVLLTLYSELLASGLYDGIMVDGMTFSDTWIGALTDPNEVGTGTINEYDAAVRVGKGVLLAGLRARFPNTLIVTNGGPGVFYPGGEGANGHWRENFPLQNDGGGWWANMLAPRGLFGDPAFYRKRPYSVIATTANPAIDRSRARFALASSCLGEGIFVDGPGDFNPAIPYMDWAQPEYRLDRRTGAAAGGVYGGWLGRPVRAAYLKPDAVTWRRDFAFGFVEVNPNAWTSRMEVWP